MRICVQQFARKPVRQKFQPSASTSMNHKTSLKFQPAIYFVLGWNSCRRWIFLLQWLLGILSYKNTHVGKFEVLGLRLTNRYSNHLISVKIRVVSVHMLLFYFITASSNFCTLNLDWHKDKFLSSFNIFINKTKIKGSFDHNGKC